MINLFEGLKRVADELGITREAVREYFKGGVFWIPFGASLVYFCGYSYFVGAVAYSPIYYAPGFLFQKLISAENFFFGCDVVVSVLSDTPWWTTLALLLCIPFLFFYHMFINFMRVLLNPLTYLKILGSSPKEAQTQLLEGAVEFLRDPREREGAVELGKEAAQAFIRIIFIDVVLLAVTAAAVGVGGFLILGDLFGWLALSTLIGDAGFKISAFPLFLIAWTWISLRRESNFRYLRILCLVAASSILLIQAADLGIDSGASKVTFWEIELLARQENQLEPIPGRWILLDERDNAFFVYDCRGGGYLTVPKRDELAAMYVMRHSIDYLQALSLSNLNFQLTHNSQDHSVDTE